MCMIFFCMHVRLNVYTYVCDCVCVYMGFDLSVNMCVCVFMYIFIYFRRKELRASLDTICSDIDELNFLDCSNELLVLL